MESPQSLLRRYHLRPRKSLGQNFLVHSATASRIVQEADIGSTDTVLEVGAGLGALTLVLAEKAKHIIAVETDLNLVAALQEELAALENVEILHGDILNLTPDTLLPPSLIPEAMTPRYPLWGARLSHYHVVANLPYYITTAVIRHLLESPVRPERLVVTVQREVAKRIVAPPGDMSLLAISVQFYGKPQLLFTIKRGAFYPIPKVQSAVVRLDLYDEPPIPVTDVASFFDVVRAGFSQKRKQLKNALSAGLTLPSESVARVLTASGVDPRRRAETLSLAEWGAAFVGLEPLRASTEASF